jgi:hypothetical protein
MKGFSTLFFDRRSIFLGQALHNLVFESIERQCMSAVPYHKLRTMKGKRTIFLVVTLIRL